ncbi:MAG: PKD domain-containing protein [Bacteroidales bacterium]|nr:PKD domain-containing protein [Bacteroidales bacterium]
MKKKYLLPSLITFLFLFEFTGNAQVTADFTADPSAGCSPLKVNFTNLSSGTGTLTYMWYFGGQQGVSSLKDPQSTYIDPGTYNVKLVVDNGTDKDSITKPIVVYKNPVANFTSVTKACAPETIQFTDLSQPGDGVITSWNWDFRTGTIDTNQHPIHIYASSGIFDVFLKVSDANGCESNLEKSQYIDIADPPSASFTANPTSSCTVPAAVVLSNTSTGQGLLTYHWDFGDYSTSSDKDPSKTYNQFGIYTIKLTVNSDYGCSDTVSYAFYASEVVAAGTLTQGGKVISNNDTICAGQVIFSSTSLGSDVVLWKFGDGKTSISKSGFHVYSQGGPYTVLLIASPGNSCADTVVWSFYMEEPLADYTMSSTYSCMPSALINFTDNSSNAVAWEWTFNDGSKAFTRNASKTYTLPAETDPYKINTEVIFNTILTVTSRNGCKNSVTKPFRIKKPTAIYTVDTTQGCFPLNVKFTDQSISDEPITSWEWIFGDGDKYTGTIDSAIHSYDSDGLFLSRLAITNNLNCKDTSYIIPVRVGKALLPDFLISKTSVCPGEAIQFTDNTPQSNYIQSWHYTVAGASINTMPGESDPVWKVDADSGYLDVGLQVNYHGCISSVVKENALYNNGAVSDFSFAFDCYDPFEYHFADLSKGAENLKWNFGDETFDDITVNPVHTYAAEGNYQVELIAFKGICADTSRKVIKVREPHATFSCDTMVCIGEPVILNATGSYSQVDYCFEKYFWKFGDTTQRIVTRRDSLEYTFSSGGTYQVLMITFYDNYCVDSAMANIRVYGPHALFTPDTSYGCSPFAVNFVDHSTPDIHPIESWYWDFADDSDTTYSDMTDTINHVFQEPGVFEVRLSVTDTLGCTGTYTETIASANPVAEFIADKPLNCTGSSINFYYSYLTGDSVIWDFGDGTVLRSSVMPVSHAFSSKGNQSVTLTIYKYGCSDTYTNPDGYIKIQQPDASFEVSDTAWNCYPKEIIFAHHDADSIIDSGTWDFGYGNSTSEYAEERRFNYPKPGDYYPSLSIMTTYGCRDTFTRQIIITGPTGTFSILPESREACRGDAITLQVGQLNDVSDFEWDLGDGRFLVGDTVTYTYDRMGTLYPKLLLYGDGGICKPPPIVDSVFVYEVIAGFDLPDTGYCDLYEMHFADTSVGNTQRIWNFSHGVTSADDELVLQFSPGNYSVELLVLNDIGCSDTVMESFVIHPLPDILLSPDTLICEGSTAVLRAAGGDVIQWYPSVGLSAVNTFTTIASPEQTTVYTASTEFLATGCRNEAQLTVSVQNDFEITVRPVDTTLIIGEQVAILADSISGLTYAWSPADGLSCSGCSSPVARPMVSTRYTLNVVDAYNCFPKEYYVNIVVDEKYSLDVPTAFTPNGDEINDVVFVGGLGIEKLIEFRIFNRWGNEVFFSDDLNRGWDGTYNGKIQNIDTYVYSVTVQYWNGRTASKKGTLSLLR